MDTQMVVVVVVALLALAAVAWLYTTNQRRARLKERFGPEYERAVRDVGTPAKAEAVLEERAARVSAFQLRKLDIPQAEEFAREWRRVQARFVDNPDAAVRDADALVAQVMSARGYPLEDFDTRAADLSVNHPRVVQNYRIARDLASRRQRGEAGTEELRQAVVNYRALFDDLLEVQDEHRRAS